MEGNLGTNHRQHEAATPTSNLTDFETGVDELNLAEFPLASISDRSLDGKKTVVFEDTVFDRREGKDLKRKLTISGSDRYGLPTALDDDVLLACIQITKLQEFLTPDVTFSRYEILKLLRWTDDAKNYHRVAKSLRRWKGLSIYSDRAFYDQEEKSWVNRDFGIFDNLYIYRREVQQGSNAPGASRLIWNDVIFKSFQAGYLKRLDWGLYTRLKSPVAKRLYRFLDKRFYHGNHVEIDLHELAQFKVRLSDGYNSAQMKRALQKGISELEVEWDLKPMPISERFEKQGKGSYVVRFDRKPKRRFADLPAMTQNLVQSPIDSGSLETTLTKRGIGPATAAELVETVATDTVKSMIELYDWYNLNGQTRGAGFLVQAIKRPEQIKFPKGFQSSTQIAAKNTAEKNRIASERKFQTQRERAGQEREKKRIDAFLSFWRALSPKCQYDFERETIDQAEPSKRQGYSRSQGQGGKLFDHYRTIILRDHFERTKGSV